MSIPAQDMPLEKLRQDVIDQLVLNYGHEKISKQAFERRLDEAFDATDHDTLSALTADLEAFENPAITNKLDHLLYADEAQAEKSEWIINILGGTNRENEDIVPASIRMINIMGGCEIDYSMARFSAPITHIKTFNIMGGAQIYVPEGVRVKTRVIPLFGGTNNSSEPGNDPNAPVVIISGLALFGGMDVGVKRTFRERMQSFADEIKQMLG